MQGDSNWVLNAYSNSVRARGTEFAAQLCDSSPNIFVFYVANFRSQQTSEKFWVIALNLWREESTFGLPSNYGSGMIGGVGLASYFSQCSVAKYKVMRRRVSTFSLHIVCLYY